MDHPIQGLMQTAMQSIKQMVDVNTIVGDPITAPDGTIIIPVSKVAFGFAAGGSEFNAKNASAQNPFGGGSGAGVSINPVAFLVVGEGGDVRLLPVTSTNTTLDRVVSMVPDLIDRLQKMFKKDEEE